MLIIINLCTPLQGLLCEVGFTSDLDLYQRCLCWWWLLHLTQMSTFHQGRVMTSFLFPTVWHRDSKWIHIESFVEWRTLRNVYIQIVYIYIDIDIEREMTHLHVYMCVFMCVHVCVFVCIYVLSVICTPGSLMISLATYPSKQNKAQGMVRLTGERGLSCQRIQPAASSQGSQVTVT
jgi:predicted CDP-diglyceride synthetase/phosphatidate cytidylyltransferase